MSKLDLLLFANAHVWGCAGARVLLGYSHMGQVGGVQAVSGGL